MVQGRDGIICAHTGSGKTVAFLAPIIARLSANMSSYPQAVVLAPSRCGSHFIASHTTAFDVDDVNDVIGRELAVQIADVANKLMAGSNMTAMALIGGANPLRQIDK